ncbi:elongation factor P [Acidimicrobiaceae bacterium]|mgnify:FL=1|jgi:elongation factor P|nr:elongation factor P [Candidatus Actinomarina sp.]MDC0058908.1 elongation factor P [Acidimicrobiaceae bacterium]NND23355.1 elongation factor P [Acidimicrobiia bacterium]OUX06427.1 MAG: elongation factor P [Acidimicrobiaceae bacterium TMED244]|tara:strand:+ start:3582 stop:4139 length:558 start_codon:yes stop_codon:yes gene_type:complete
MVSTNDIRPGQSILVDNTLYLILEYQHVKPGKGKAFVKTKLKNLSSGGVLDKTFRADEDVQQAFIDKQMFQFLYKDGEDFIFMNNDTYEQLSLSPSIVEDKYLFLTSNQEVTIQMYNDTPIDLVLPPTVSLKVSKAEPAVKGDTVSSSTKSITCETGLVLNVPMFIEQDEMIKVDTKNSSYMTRI